MSAIEGRVKTVIAKHLGIAVDRVKPESHISNDLGADSLDKVEIVMELEAEFDLDIADDDSDRIETVQQAVDLIEKITAGK